MQKQKYMLAPCLRKKIHSRLVWGGTVRIEGEGGRYLSIARSLKKNANLLPKYACELKGISKEIRASSFWYNAELHIFLVSDKTIGVLNKRYRGRDKTTNVLSFVYDGEFPRGKGERKMLGEIYLAPDYIKVHGEVITDLLVHGFLHILGYDHKTNRDMMSMQKAENILLKKLTANNNRVASH